MQFHASLAATAILVGMAAPAPARAWGVPGCINLPTYERALGALQGMTGPCDMSVDEASRIVAAHGNVPGGVFGALSAGPPRPPADAVPIVPSPRRRAPGVHDPVHRDAARRGETVAR